MSYHSVRAAAYVFDPLDGSTIGTAFGSPSYSATGPLGRDMLVGGGSTYVSYTPPTVPVNATAAGWYTIPTNGDARLFGLHSSFIIYGNRDSCNPYVVDSGGGKQISSQNLPDDTLFHYAQVADGSTLKYYIDGVETGSISAGNIFSSGSQGLLLLRAQTSSAVSGARAAEFGFWTSALTAGEIADLVGLEEPTYTSGASLSDAGAWNVGTWDSYSNGTATYSVVAANAAGTTVDTDTGATGTLDLSTAAGTLVYLYVRATNSGGYDVGDYATRTGGYGSANDGYYEVASVTAAGGGGGSNLPVIQHHLRQLMAA